MPSSRRRHRFSLVAAAAIAGAFAAGPALAGQLFSDDIAVDVDGEFRSLFQHVMEPDADNSVRPDTVNRANSRLRLAPTLWINEFLSIETMFDGTANWGSGAGAFDSNGQSGSLDFALARAAMKWQTPIGLFTAGRAGWHWGLGLFEHDGRSDFTQYGVATGTGAQDALRYRVAPAGIDTPFFLTVFMRQWFFGAESATGFVDNGWSYGLAIEGTPDLGEFGLQVRMDRHRANDTSMLWSGAYAKLPFWLATLSLESAVNWGRTGNKNRSVPDHGIHLINDTGLRVERSAAENYSLGAVLRFMFDRAEAGPVQFETSGIELGILSGDTLAQSLSAGEWGWMSANPDYRVGLLLLPEMWPARRAALAQALIGAAEERVAGSTTSLQQTYDARVGTGLGNVLYLYPGIGLRTEDDLRFRLNFLYARSLYPLPTLQTIDDKGTIQTFDDVYREDNAVGFELDLHLSYPLWGTVYGVIETGVAFPGSGFVNAGGGDPPVGFMLMPRLTVSF